MVIRRPAQLVTTAAAVTFAGTEPTTTQTPFFFVAGGNVRPAFYIDGGNATNTRVESTLLVQNPNIEVTKEFRLVELNYKAEYGGSGGGLMLLTTKSGGNEIHGTVWEFHRQRALDARNTFAAEKTPFREHTYGVAIGAPSRKTSCIILAAGKQPRIRSLRWLGQGEASRQILPNAPDPGAEEWRLLRLRNANGALRVIYDPASTKINPDGSITRTPFPGNIIPADRITTLAKKISAYMPAPNTAPLDVTGTNNYVGAATNGTDRNAFTADSTMIILRMTRCSSASSMMMAPSSTTALGRVFLMPARLALLLETSEPEILPIPMTLFCNLGARPWVGAGPIFSVQHSSTISECTMTPARGVPITPAPDLAIRNSSVSSSQIRPRLTKRPLSSR
jgi:hypothetical protein